MKSIKYFSSHCVHKRSQGWFKYLSILFRLIRVHIHSTALCKDFLTKKENTVKVSGWLVSASGDSKSIQINRLDTVM